MRRVRAAGVGLTVGTTLGLLGGVGVAGASSGGNISSQSPSQILSSAVSATRSATSYTLNGIVHQSGSATKVVGFSNLQVSNSHEATGNISINGNTVQIREVGGNLYLNGSANFWRSEANSTAARLFGGKWVYGPSSKFGSLASEIDPQTLTSNFTSLGAAKGASKGRETTIAGQRVIPLSATSSSQGTGVIDVAATGKPYIVRISLSKGSSSGVLTFTHYNASVNVSKPSGGINISEASSGSNG